MIRRSEWPALLTGLLATFTGIGVARFSYTALLPTIIQQGWFSSDQAAYLGAANLLGYLFGALSAHRLSERYSPRWVLAISFAVVALSFFCCAWPARFEWFFLWRCVSGVAGAILMVVGPSLALAALPSERKAVIGAMVFSGIGFGALFAAVVLPLLLAISQTYSWWVLGLAVLVAGVISDRAMRQLPRPAASPSVDGADVPSAKPSNILWLVIIAYGCDAAGFVPHTVFWVDYLVRSVGLSRASAALQWALFGVGAILGPWVIGQLARRYGWQRSLVGGYSLKCLAIAVPLVSTHWLALTLSAFLVGALIPGLVALTSGRVAELVGAVAHKRIWGLSTAVFAAAQAISGFALSAWHAATGSYLQLFAVGAALLGIGCILILISNRLANPASAPSRPSINR